MKKILSVAMIFMVAVFTIHTLPRPALTSTWSPYARMSYTLTETRFAMVASNGKHDPNYIVVVFSDNLTGQYDWYSTKSTDGGATWTAPEIAVDPDFDVMTSELHTAAIAMDDNGLVHMSFAREKTQWPRDTAPTGIYYARYDGTSWSAPIPIHENMSPGYLLLYTNDICIGRNNVIHLAYGSDLPGNDNGDIWYSRSEDSGVTWTSPININAFGWMDCGYRPSLATDDFGYVYYAVGGDWYNWAWTGEMYFRRSQDDGATWDPQMAISRRVDGDRDPRLLCDNSGGVYALWYGSGSLMFKRSTDHGSTWTPHNGGITLRDNEPGMGSGYFAELDDYGVIHIVYQSTATGTTETYYMSVDTSGNIVDPPQIITPDDGYPSIPTGLALAGNRIYVTTKDCKDGNWEAYFFCTCIPPTRIIEKSLDTTEGGLGDVVHITLTVTAPYSETVAVVDTLPSEWTYLAGTFTVDSVSATPTISKIGPPPPIFHEISYTVTEFGTHTIEFDCKVDTANWEDREVCNTAEATWYDEAGEIINAEEDTKSFTIHAFEELSKSISMGDEPFVYLYVDEFSEWYYEWNNPPEHLFGVPDGNYIEGDANAQWASLYSFEDIDLAGREIAEITLEGYAQYPNGANDGVDIDVYDVTGGFVWWGSLWGTPDWGWHGVRWIEDSVLTLSPRLANETELNNVQVLMYNYYGDDPDVIRLDSMRLKVEFVTDVKNVTIKEKTEVQWEVVMEVTNSFSYTMKNVTIKDSFGAELEFDGIMTPPDTNFDGVVNIIDLSRVAIHYGTFAVEAKNKWDPAADLNRDGIVDMRDLHAVASDLGLTLWTTGKSDKLHLFWNVGDLAPGETAQITLLVSTDLNPAGHQEYTEPGVYEMNSGATLTFIDPEQDMQLSAVTAPIYVTVLPLEDP